MFVIQTAINIFSLATLESATVPSLRDNAHNALNTYLMNRQFRFSRSCLV